MAVSLPTAVGRAGLSVPIFFKGFPLHSLTGPCWKNSFILSLRKLRLFIPAIFPATPQKHFCRLSQAEFQPHAALPRAYSAGHRQPSICFSPNPCCKTTECIRSVNSAHAFSHFTAPQQEPAWWLSRAAS